MAASKSILEALSDLNDHLVEAKCLADTFTDLNAIDTNAPSWPLVFSRHIDRIQMAAEALETLVRQRALPHLADLEKLASDSQNFQK